MWIYIFKSNKTMPQLRSLFFVDPRMKNFTHGSNTIPSSIVFFFFFLIFEMQCVLNCKTLIDLIKDFAGFLSEYPLYFITKTTPRIWAYDYLNNGIWILPDKRKVFTQVLRNFFVTGIHESKPKTRIIQFKVKNETLNFCLTKENCVYPENTFCPTEDLIFRGEVTSSSIRRFPDPTLIALPLPISVKVLVDPTLIDYGYPCYLYTMAANEIRKDEDFNLELAYWYSCNFPLFLTDHDTLNKRIFSDKYDSQKRYGSQQEKETFLVSQLPSAEFAEWLFPNLKTGINWIAYHYNFISRESLLLARNEVDIAREFSTCLHHKCFSTAKRMLTEKKILVACLENINQLELEDVKFIASLCDLSQHRVNFGECFNKEVKTFLLGKIAGGYLTAFDFNCEKDDFDFEFAVQCFPLLSIEEQKEFQKCFEFQVNGEDWHTFFPVDREIQEKSFYHLCRLLWSSLREEEKCLSILFPKLSAKEFQDERLLLIQETVRAKNWKRLQILSVTKKEMDKFI
jgi:hypothetical protein